MRIRRRCKTVMTDGGSHQYGSVSEMDYIADDEIVNRLNVYLRGRLSINIEPRGIYDSHAPQECQILV